MAVATTTTYLDVRERRDGAYDMIVVRSAGPTEVWRRAVPDLFEAIRRADTVCGMLGYERRVVLRDDG